MRGTEHGSGARVVGRRRCCRSKGRAGERTSGMVLVGCTEKPFLSPGEKYEKQGEKPKIERRCWLSNRFSLCNGLHVGCRRRVATHGRWPHRRRVRGDCRVAAIRSSLHVQLGRDRTALHRSKGLRKVHVSASVLAEGRVAKAQHTSRISLCTPLSWRGLSGCRQRVGDQRWRSRQQHRAAEGTSSAAVALALSPSTHEKHDAERAAQC